ncbi:hypothetical protein QZH41_020386 [Actinostola sp. cb2023]|nr:hypothetical protein QZH41_020386 [Actinostola sp. cb2023]
MDEESNTTKEREERESRKRRRRSKGSQTSEELDESNECTNCKNMADVLCEINAKLDKIEKKNFSKTEAILREFLECELQISKNEVQEISIERAHRIGKRNPYPSHKPRPIIAKFSFFKDQQYVLSKSRSLAGTNYGISEDYPKEIVEIRKSLIPLMKEAKKNGQRAKLVLDKLYIDGKLVDNKQHNLMLTTKEVIQVF